MNRRFPRNEAFTLLELLVVIGIISLLLVALVPAVNSLSKSGGRKAAISLILGVIEQARAQAIKDSRATYVVFPGQAPNSTSGITDKNILTRYFYHSVAIFEDDPNDTSKPKIQVTPWKILPLGVSLRSEISFTTASSANASWNWSAFAFTPAGAQTQTFPYMQFNEGGALVYPTAIDPAQPVKLRLFEGFVTGTYEQATTKANRDEIISIAPTTGRAEYSP